MSGTGKTGPSGPADLIMGSPENSNSSSSSSSPDKPTVSSNGSAGDNSSLPGSPDFKQTVDEPAVASPPSPNKKWQKFHADLVTAAGVLEAQQPPVVTGSEPLPHEVSSMPFFVEWAARGYLSEMKEIYQEHCQAHKDPLELIEQMDKSGRTPAHYAAKRSSLEMLQWLQQQNANLNAVDAGGNTPLDLAELTGATPAVIDFLNNHATTRATPKL